MKFAVFKPPLQPGTPAAGRIIVRFVTALLAALLLWQIVTGIASFRAAGAPPAVQIPAQSPTEAAQAVIAGKLFGESATPVAEPVHSSLNLRLKGVYAPRFAIFSAGGKVDIGVVAGSEIQPGARLQSVYPDHVLILHDGALERLDLAVPTPTPGQSPAGPKLAPGTTALSRSALAPIVAEPGTADGLSQLGTYPTLNIIVNDAHPGSLAARLGLVAGDAVQKINDKPVSAKEDLLRVAQASPVGGQVSIELTRSGQVIRLVYSLQP
jgi:membrane-associated protease RseP (regulator of RpoE activity)